MIDTRAFSLLTLRLRHERHVVHARQRARDIAALLGFEHQEQIRLATAASELARNAFRYASNGAVEFLVRGEVVLVATVKSLVRLHRTESQSQLAAKQWQATFDALDEGVAILDSSDVVQRCNRAMTNLLSQCTGRYNSLR